MSTWDASNLDLALEQAKLAASLGEVPVGAVIVKDGKVIAQAHNVKEFTQNAVGHAEILAIQKATTLLGDWRLDGCDLYCTLEPCPMCAGAMLHARIRHVFYGAKDKKWGAAGSVVHLLDKPYFNHQTIATYIPDSRCSEILSNFFQKLR